MTRAAIILAGGRGRRLGAIRKVELSVGGTALVNRVLTACAGWTAVVVGPADLDLASGVPIVTDEPAFLGPVNGLRAGILALPQEAERVAVLAGDQPFVTSAALNQLCAAIGGGEAAAYVRDGQLQFLCAVWDGAALRRRLATAGSSMRSLYAAATVVEVADRAGVSRDVDTPADLAAVRRLVRDPVEAGIDIAPIAPGEGDQRQPKRGGRLHGE